MKFVYFLSSLAILQGIVALIDGLRAARYLRRSADSQDPFEAEGIPSTCAVFCPCKGVDPEFEKNIRSILEQDHSRFRVFFIVESDDDPAYRVLAEMGAAPILIAGKARDCGQKVHNLRFAVQTVGASADTYVFCDADARYPRTWLRNLTRPLADAGVAVATGYRWYVAERFHVPTLLRSAWNASVVSMLGDHKRNFAWGGSMAVRRETFHRLRIADAWRGAVSDDYAVTRAAQQAGETIRFVGQCLIPSFGECSFGQLLEFTNRQIIITRVYHPRMWVVGFVAQTVFSLTFLLLTTALLSDPAAVALWCAVYALAAGKSAIRIASVRKALHDPALSRFGWFYILSSPVIALLYQYNMICSALTREIEWRQIHYRLISPNETSVRHFSANGN